MTVTILGTHYEIIFKKYNEDEHFKTISAFCDGLQKQIVVCDLTTDPGYCEPKKYCELAHKVLIRHEIVHAFLFESGLDANSNSCDGAWALNEEMIDWIAFQHEKIHEAYREAGVLSSDGKKTGALSDNTMDFAC